MSLPSDLKIAAVDSRVLGFTSREPGFCQVSRILSSSFSLPASAAAVSRTSAALNAATMKYNPSMCRFFVVFVDEIDLTPVGSL